MQVLMPSARNLSPEFCQGMAYKLYSVPEPAFERSYSEQPIYFLLTLTALLNVTSVGVRELQKDPPMRH